jgi:uncharacterized protein
MTLRNMILPGIVMITACATTTAPPQYLALRVDDERSGTTAPKANLPTVYIGPVTVPEAIDRPQLVIHGVHDEVNVLEGQRWIEPLKIAIGRVVATTLGRELGGAVVGAYPGTALTGATYRVQIEVQTLEAIAGTTRFDAVWSVHTEAGKTSAGRSIGTRTGTNDYPGIATTYTQAAVAIANDIAAALRAESALTTQ